MWKQICSHWKTLWLNWIYLCNIKRFRLKTSCSQFGLPGPSTPLNQNDTLVIHSPDGLPQLAWAGSGTQLPLLEQTAFMTADVLLHWNVTLAFSKVLKYILMKPLAGASGSPQSTRNAQHRSLHDQDNKCKLYLSYWSHIYAYQDSGSTVHSTHK